MSENLLTIREIARRLDLPESNVRYYRDKFEKYLPSVGSGRKKRFKPEAMDIFEAIVQGLNQNLSSSEIEAGLAGQFSQNPSIYQEYQNPASSQTDKYPVPDSYFFQDILSSQAGALEKMAEALRLEHGFKQDLLEVRAGCARMKKALGIIWQKQKDMNRTDPGVDKRLRAVEDELQAINERQNTTEQRMHKELGELREELKKCQFWTKRVLMQASSRKISEE
ncbi:MAG: MerR family transcriptional regulator [Desulfonatronovibrio sp.]